MSKPEKNSPLDETIREKDVGEQRTTVAPDGRVIHYTFIGASQGKFTTELTSLLMKYADHSRSAEPTESLRRRMNKKIKATDRLDNSADAEDIVMRLNNKEREILKKWLEKALTQDPSKNVTTKTNEQKPRIYKGPRGNQFVEELNEYERIQEDLSA